MLILDLTFFPGSLKGTSIHMSLSLESHMFGEVNQSYSWLCMFFFCGILNVCHQCSLVTLSMQLGLHIGDFLDSTIVYTVCFPCWFSCSYLLSANQLSQLKATAYSQRVLPKSAQNGVVL